MRNIKYKKGFTLIELLIVLSMMGVVMGIGVAILGSTLRSTTKTTIINRVKQNGDLAMETITRSMQSAQDVCTPSPQQIKIYASTVGDCVSTLLTPVLQFNCTVGDANTNGQLTKDGLAILSDVKISSCTFAASNSTPKRVSIDFTLAQDASLGNAPDTAVSLPFHTEVTLRNF